MVLSVIKHNVLQFVRFLDYKSWGASKSHYWFKRYGDFAEWMDFAYCWSFRGAEGSALAACPAGLFISLLQVGALPPLCGDALRFRAEVRVWTTRTYTLSLIKHILSERSWLWSELYHHHYCHIHYHNHVYISCSSSFNQYIFDRQGSVLYAAKMLRTLAG